MNRKRIALRRIGNSLGVIIPRRLLTSWGLSEGHALEVTERGLRVPSPASSHVRLDEHKRRLAAAVAARFPAQEIRAHGLANLHRWKQNGMWVADYAEWQRILERADDGELFAVLLGRDDRAQRLRQSPPYVGLLPRDEVIRLNEEAAA
jgi:antitoxin component of MazEF toxin-antitoxin module